MKLIGHKSTTAELDLEPMKQRLIGLPAGPWHFNGRYPYGISNAIAALIVHIFKSPPYPEVIAEFLGHAREDLPALITEVERLRNELHRIGGKP